MYHEIDILNILFNFFSWNSQDNPVYYSYFRDKGNKTQERDLPKSLNYMWVSNLYPITVVMKDQP